MDETIAQALRQGRLEAGLSFRQLAAQLGISAAFLSDCEQGRRKLTRARIVSLPDDIRHRVVAAAIGEHERAIEELERIG